MTDSTALKIVSIASSLTTPSSTEGELTQVASVLSNSISFAQYSEAGVSIIEAIRGATDSIVSIAVEGGSAFKISSSKLVIQVQTIDPNSPSTVSPTDELTVTLPTGLSSGSNVQLSTVVMKDSLYQSVAPSGTNQATDTLSLNIFSDKAKQKISGLS